MSHGMYRVTGFDIIGPYQLRVRFDDGVVQEINFYPMLAGALYTPLKDLEFFNRVRLDAEVWTLVWPNDADFDPETLHDWPELADELTETARRWERKAARRRSRPK